MRRGILLCLFVLLLTSPARSPAQKLFASGQYRIEWRDISGDSISEARTKLLVSGPKDPQQRARYGKTNWKITWRFVHDQKKICDVFTDTEILVVLPRLNPASRMSERDREIWFRMYAALLDHELGHAHVPTETARTIEGVIPVIARHRELSALEANRIINRLIADNNRWDRRYDAETAHGALQGATLLGNGQEIS